jgi:hypothetical protein
MVPYGSVADQKDLLFFHMHNLFLIVIHSNINITTRIDLFVLLSYKSQVTNYT